MSDHPERLQLSTSQRGVERGGSGQSVSEWQSVEQPRRFHRRGDPLAPAPAPTGNATSQVGLATTTSRRPA